MNALCYLMDNNPTPDSPGNEFFKCESRCMAHEARQLISLRWSWVSGGFAKLVLACKARNHARTQTVSLHSSFPI